MKTRESVGFFCVVYLQEAQKTVFYNKTWNPSKLASYLNNSGKSWLWIKIYIRIDDYFSDTKGNNYYAIFDKENSVTNLTYKPFLKH